MRLFRRWLSWFLWLFAAVAAAIMAQYWNGPIGPAWARLSWLLPVGVLVGLVFSAYALAGIFSNLEELKKFVNNLPKKLH